jgi:hypothetical protein
MSQRNYEIKSYAQDPESQKKRTQYAETLLRDMNARAFIEKIQEDTGMNMFKSPNSEDLPENKEELSLHMQLSYKQSIEIAEEEAISNVLANNKYHETKTTL